MMYWQFPAKMFSLLLDCMTKEQLNTVHRLIDRSQTICFNWDTNARNIIMEEAEYYFNDKRSIDDVMKNIESRMNLYVEEKNKPATPKCPICEYVLHGHAFAP